MAKTTEKKKTKRPAEGWAVYYRQKRADRQAEGRCLWCTEKAEEGYALCAKHRAGQNDYNRKKRADCKAKGLCPRCWTRKARRGMTLCQHCLDGGKTASVA